MIELITIIMTAIITVTVYELMRMLFRAIGGKKNKRE